MEMFKKLFFCWCSYEPEKIDIIAELPAEISNIIFRKLDDQSMCAAMMVSRTWYGKCQYERRRRHRIKKEDHHMKKKVCIKRYLSQRIHRQNQTAVQPPVHLSCGTRYTDTTRSFFRREFKVPKIKSRGTSLRL